MSRLVRKLEEQKKEMWAKRLGVRKYVDQKFLRSRGRDRAKIEEMRKLLQEWTDGESSTRSLPRSPAPSRLSNAREGAPARSLLASERAVMCHRTSVHVRVSGEPDVWTPGLRLHNGRAAVRSVWPVRGCEKGDHGPRP